MSLPKIFAFINGRHFNGCNADTLTEDGLLLVSRTCSSEKLAPYTMGFNSNWTHDIYNACYPGGWDLVWVDYPDEDPNLKAAYERHLAYTAEEYEAKLTKIKAAVERTRIEKETI